MDPIVDGVARFRTTAFQSKRSLYERLATHGQEPKALFISCSDSRVVPEFITQSEPGDMFVTRNAGNVVPPFGEMFGGVTAAIEYAVVGLGVEHIVVCGHSDCGAMKALLHPEALAEMPNVAAWLGHCKCAHNVFRRVHQGKMNDKEAVRLLAMENVVAQLTHLRTHPCVAERIATGDLSLHGWFFEIESGTVFAMDGKTGAFSPVEGDRALPIALPGEHRAVNISHNLIAAE